MPKPPPPSDDSRAVLDAIRLIVREVRLRSRESERRAGLGGAQLFVLSRLAEAPASSINELAQRTLTHQSSVSVVVSKLQRRGLVRRDASATDARRQELSLTARGRALLRRAPRSPAHVIIDALSHRPRREVRQLAKSLHSLLAQMGVAPNSRAPLFDDDNAAGKST